MIILCNKRTVVFMLSLVTFFFIVGITISYFDLQGSLPVTSREKRIVSKTIVIDPGHGGVDRGSCYNNLVEKNINLDIAQRLKRLLSNKGAKVVMTRYHDTALDHKNKAYKSRHKRDLKARVDIINSVKADLFISLHVNYFPGQFRIRGPISFYQDIRSENKILAQKIQKRLNQISYKGVKMKGNSIRKGDYYILNNSKVPGILIEVGFINDKVDQWLLTKSKFKNVLVYSIYKGVVDYLQ